MLILKMVFLLSCHGARLMANVDVISSNGVGMTAKDHIKMQCDPEYMRGPELLFFSLYWQMYSKSTSCLSPHHFIYRLE